MAINLGQIEKQNQQRKIPISKSNINNNYKEFNGLKLSKIKTEKQEEKKQNKIFNTGAFSDGYQFGDVTKTVLGTGADLLLNATKGVANIGASAAKLVAGGVADVADIIGQDEFANKVRTNIKTKENPVIKTISNVDNNVNKNSVSGEYVDKVAELMGYTAGLAAGSSALSGLTGTATIGGTTGATISGGNIGLTIAGHTLNLPTLALIGGASSGYEEALNKKDANMAERWAKSISSGLIEGTTEGIFGMFGVGGNELTDALGEKLASKFSTSAGKILAKLGMSATGESAEEFLSYAGNWLVDNNIINKLGNADFKSKWDWGEVGEQMALAFASSALSQGGASVLSTNSAIKSAEQQLGRKLNNQEKVQVTQAVIEGTAEEKINKIKSNQNIDQTNMQNKNNIDNKKIVNIPGLQLPNNINNLSTNNNIINDLQRQNNQQQNIPMKLDTQIENAISNNQSKNKSYLGKVTSNIAAKIKSLTGIDVLNRTHILTDSDIRHILNSHGNEKIESARGQIAITKEDIKNIPNIISNPDNIVKGTTNKEGTSIRYIKSFNDGNTFVVEVIPEKGESLKIKTMWKTPTTTVNALNNNSTLRHTSETDSSSSASTSNDILSQNTENIKLPVNSNMQQNQNNTQQNIPTYKDVNELKVSPVKNSLNEVKNISPTREEAYANDYSKKLTRKEVRQQLIEEMNITPAELSNGNDIKSINYQLTDPIRVNEKVFGRELGKKINDVTINQTKHNTAEKTRWLNQQRSEIESLGIKARSKESAAVQKYAEGNYVNDKGELVKYGDIELMSEFPSSEIQEKIKNAANVLRGKYDTYIDQINEVITSLGYDAIPKRKDYMRHFQELGDIFSKTGIPFNLNDMKAEDLPTDINGLTEFNRPGKNWFANAQQRTGIKTTYDAITGIDGYLEGAGNLIYHTADIQRYRALSGLIRDTFGQTKGFDNLENLSSKELQQRIKDIQDNKLSKYVAWLDGQANNLAGKKSTLDRGVERAIGRKGYTFFNTIKKQVGSNMTGYNVRSSLTNLISSTIAGAKTNKIALVKGTISTINNMFKNDGFINKSDFLTNRFGSDSLSSKWWQKASNAGQIFMTGTDYFTSNQIVRSKYYEGLQKGMTETDAIKYADDFASRVMGDRSQGSTAEVFNSKTLGLFTQFQLEVNNQWQYMIHDTKLDYQTNSEINGGLKAGATMLFQLGQLAAYSYFFNELFEKLTGSRAAFDPIEILKKLFGLDDEEDKKKNWDERLSEAGSLLVDNIPFGNIITGGGRIPIAEAFTGLSTLGKKLTGQKDDFGNDITWDEVGKDILETIPYYVMPTGYSQAKKTLKGLSMYKKSLPISGSYTDSGNLRFNADESIDGKIKSALFGQYSSEEAQKYIDSGFKAISKNNIEEMKQLKMSSSEYRDYRSGLTKSGTTNKEKMDYISNLKNVTDKQKNIMASNVLKREVDIKEYKKYDSYEEFDYAYKNPEKYAVIKNITSYDKYVEYKEKLKQIRDNTKEDKNETIKYINSLKLSIPQKAIFIKQYYPSFNNYNKEIAEYITSQKISASEKETILKKLGFTIKDGRVYY